MSKSKWILSFSLMALFGLLFISCEKDHEDLILGRWVFERARFVLTEDQEIVLDSITYDMGLKYLEFYESGSMDMTYEDGETEGAEWMIEGDSLVIDLTDAYESRLEIRTLDREELVLSSTTGQGSDWIYEQIVNFSKED